MPVSSQRQNPWDLPTTQGPSPPASRHLPRSRWASSRSWRRLLITTCTVVQRTTMLMRRWCMVQGRSVDPTIPSTARSLSTTSCHRLNKRREKWTWKCTRRCRTSTRHTRRCPLWPTTSPKSPPLPWAQRTVTTNHTHPTPLQHCEWQIPNPKTLASMNQFILWINWDKNETKLHPLKEVSDSVSKVQVYVTFCLLFLHSFNPLFNDSLFKDTWLIRIQCASKEVSLTEIQIETQLRRLDLLYQSW